MKNLKFIIFIIFIGILGFISKISINQVVIVLTEKLSEVRMYLWQLFDELKIGE